jgi:hypothetical protein
MRASYLVCAAALAAPGVITGCAGGVGFEGGGETAATGTSGGATTTNVTTGPDPSSDPVGEPCDLLVCGPDCVDPMTDAAHCGGCDRPCDASQQCSAGKCVDACPMDQVFCDGECFAAGEPLDCSPCPGVCGPGLECMDGACAPNCPADEAACGESCADLQTDEAHCGDCDVACADGDPCVAGGCDAADVVHLLITGQSLSTGYGSEVVSTMQTYFNLSFNTGVRAGAMGLTGFIPLVETSDGMHGETIASGMANLAGALWEAEGFAPRDFLVSAHGVDGAPYSAIKKGTEAYAAGLAQVTAGKAIAEAGGKTYEVRAVAAIHGESDHIGFPPDGNPDYGAALLEWRADYEADIQAITGQTAPVRLFYCQMSSWTALDMAPRSRIPELQRQVAADDPERFALVGPKYFLAYTDGVHLTGASERWLGEYYAKALARVYLAGEPWLPLTPTAAKIDGNDVVVDFAVPVPPLVFDTTLVSDPGAYGFSFVDMGQFTPSIAAVELTGPAQVTVTLAGPPGPGARLGYAISGEPGAPAGPTTGPRGNLRDSDAAVSLSGSPLYNWAVHFELALN